MSELDDLPIDPARDTSTSAFSTDTSRPSWAPLALLALAITGLGGLAWFFWPGERAVEPPASAVDAAPAAAVTAPAVTLPPLEEMDPFLRTLLSGLSSHPQLVAWLATDDLLGGLATAIDRLAQGQTPARDLAPLRPGGAFTVTTRGGQTVVSPASFARYDPLVAAVASVDPAKLADAFRLIEPRLAEAYARQGHTGSVRDAVQRAAAVIVGTPDTPETIALVRGVAGYGFADPRLEALPAAQKQLLRMGPANAATVRQAVSAFAAALLARQ
jgi:hypothetical protein